MTRRFFIVGTDTGVGKTCVTAALLRAASEAGLKATAFKPAMSGPAADDDDLERLRLAASPPLSRDEICSFTYALPVAPGIAENPAPFTGDPPDPQRAQSAVDQALRDLETLENKHQPDLSFIEGAGGLRVPMPGGAWLDAWLPAFDAPVVVVGRAGLGTLNHTLLTIEALERRELPIAGFVLSHTVASDPRAPADPSLVDNLAVLEANCRYPCLGVLPFAPTSTTITPANAWLRDPSFASWRANTD